MIPLEEDIAELEEKIENVGGNVGGCEERRA